MENWIFWIVLALVVAQYGFLFVRPKSDIPRIKRDYEANGARVVSLSPAGFEIGFLRRGHYYRKYRIVVDRPLTGRSTHVVGVAATWFSDTVKTYDA
jgi:hypothetical protein